MLQVLFATTVYLCRCGIETIQKLIVQEKLELARFTELQSLDDELYFKDENPSPLPTC